MKSAVLHNDFLHTIEDLYSRVTFIILQNRINNGHQKAAVDNIEQHSLDIKAPLYKYIEDVRSKDQNTVPQTQTLDYSFFSQPSKPYTPSKHELANQKIAVKNYVGELSKYFKAYHNYSELHPSIAEKLEHSTWEHLHASIRHARQGEQRLAQMHADIANNAYKELAHYVSNEAHAEFTKEIQGQLGTLFK